MATQVCLIGLKNWTVDAITRIPIYMTFVYRPNLEGKLINTGAVVINLYPDSTTTTLYAMQVGEIFTFKAGEIRGTLFAGGQNGAPICYALAASGTGSLQVLEL